MELLNRVTNSFLFWGAWIIIPVLMEIIPSLGSLYLLVKRRISNKMHYKSPTIYPDITLIIPVYNSEATLYNCIKSISDADYPNKAMDIMLVNNQGQDNSFAVYAQCQKEFPDLHMQWMNAEQGKSRALNMALYNSEGKYIINLDSDGMLEKKALKNMVKKFEANSDINCMTGAILTTPSMIKEYKHFFPRLLRNLEFMEYAQAFLAGRSYAAETNSVYTLSGAFSAFRKSAVLTSRLYNTNTICEDTNITFQMRYLQNEKIEICEDAIFFVDPIEGFNKLYTQRQRWQRGSLEVAHQFMDKKFKLRNLIKDVNVRTMMYDHTSAFPRMIWYLAVLCLIAMNYSGKIVLYSTGVIFIMYILIGLGYFTTASLFLRFNPEIHRYYTRHVWCVALLPFFNLMVFFIRMIGIVNSIGTDSSWRTKTLSDEWHDFQHAAKDVFSKPKNLVKKIRKAVNEE